MTYERWLAAYDSEKRVAREHSAAPALRPERVIQMSVRAPRITTEERVPLMTPFVALTHYRARRWALGALASLFLFLMTVAWGAMATKYIVSLAVGIPFLFSAGLLPGIGMITGALFMAVLLSAAIAKIVRAFYQISWKLFW